MPARLLDVFEHIRTKAAMRHKDDCTPSTWTYPKAATFYEKLIRVCAELLYILRENYGDETIELPPEVVDIIFESLAVPNQKNAVA